MKFLEEFEESSVYNFVEAINEGNVSEIHRLMSKDHIFIDLSGDIHKGEKEINWEGYFRIFPDYKITIEKTIQKNNYVHLLGYSEGNFSKYGKKLFIINGKEPESQDFQGSAVWRANVEDDKIKEWRIFNYDKETLDKIGID